MRVLILGAGGQLGKEVLRATPPGVKASAYTSAVCDIRDVQLLRRVLHEAAPDVVINCAAYTKVDQAESEPSQAFAVNDTGVRNLALVTAASVRLVHVSTDFVFDGRASQPYTPDAETAPLGVYGASKLAGEQALLELAPARSAIVRTAWLYSAEGHNFLNTMLQLMATRDSLRVVSDQRGTPTACHGLARALWALAATPHTGIFHWTDGGEATWHEFACEIQRQALERGLLQRAIPIAAIPSEDWPTPARRPAYSVLDKRSTLEALKLQLHPWQAMLGEVLDRRAALAAAAAQAPTPDSSSDRTRT
jgi:dTDP-4-dehydrorhamnose reductase